MSTTTNIEWCDSTFNPWIGCTKVSPACDDCYAARSTPARALGVQWGAGQPRRRTSDDNWKLPERWQREAAAFHAEHGRRRRVFCASLADVFDNEVPTAWRVDLLRLIEATPDVDWLLLTKRIGNVDRLLDEAAHLMPEVMKWPLPNVWLGATVVNQAEADRDIPKLLAVPARVRFLSIEPMLGPIDLREIPLFGSGHHELDPIVLANVLQRAEAYPPLPSVDWVICGGESGPKARPMHPDWARSLRDQCAAAGVPFLFKQWGEWIPGESEASADGYRIAYPDEVCNVELGDGRRYATTTAHEREFLRVGKSAAGRLLDGVEHNGFPGPTA